MRLRRLSLQAVFAGLVPALALGLVTTLATPAPAGLPDSEKAEWQQRYRDLLESVSAAASRYEAARVAYSMNRLNNLRLGEARAEINEEFREAQIELATAQAELADFPELARRAGVLPGWLREVDDSAGAASADGF